MDIVLGKATGYIIEYSNLVKFWLVQLSKLLGIATGNIIVYSN
jgi:hypothetical protein